MRAPAAAAARGPAGLLLGTLAVGAEADVTVLHLEDGRFDLTDSAGTTRQAGQRLVPVAVVRAGRSVPIEPLVSDPPIGISPG